jgi:tagaturonate reductase
MSDRPRLSREVVTSLAFSTRTDVEVPPVGALDLSERVVQFGTGGFLRGFIDYFIDDANRRGEFGGTIVAVSSTGSSRDALLNDQDGLFTLALQGVENGVAKQRYRVVSSVSRALAARDEWTAILGVARDPNLRLIVSNTTEVGIALDESDTFDAKPPKSFPGKLVRFLYERATHFRFDRTRGVIVLPCELIENNGAALRDIVVLLAHRWKLDRQFLAWLEASVTFCNTLVDRIVPGAPSRDEVERAERLFGYRDGMFTVSETYALFAIEGDDTLRSRLGFAGEDPRIVVAADIRPYRERKVRILNGGHTICVPTALLAGLETVRDAVTDARVGQFMRRAMLDEIVPTVDAPDAEAFARDVLGRFANPYINHSLIDITLHATTKMRVRVVPSIVQYHERFCRVPASLALGFAAFLAFLHGEVHAERRAAGLSVPDDNEGETIRAGWREVDLTSEASIAAFAEEVCADQTLWESDLSALDGFAPLVAEHLVRIMSRGVSAALDAHLTEPTPVPS